MWQWNEMMYETQRRRQAEKAAIQRKMLIQGLFLAPALFLGWFFVIWCIAKIFKL